MNKKTKEKDNNAKTTNIVYAVLKKKGKILMVSGLNGQSVRVIVDLTMVKKRE